MSNLPGSVNLPFIPPFWPYLMPNQGFNQLINATGARFTWQKSHLCPCVYGNLNLTGSPDPQCQTCKGHGWYWDPPSVPFIGLITFIHLAPAPDEPGARMNDKFGSIYRAEPAFTIPSDAGDVYNKASINDAFTEKDSIDRFQAQLQVGGIQSVPYQQSLTIAPSGAVTVYENTQATQVSGYVVSGATVTLPNTFPSGTSYIVEFTAAKTFIAWRRGGALGHNRPFQQQLLPRRFHLQQLDIWLRNTGVV